MSFADGCRRETIWRALLECPALGNSQLGFRNVEGCAVGSGPSRGGSMRVYAVSLRMRASPRTSIRTSCEEGGSGRPPPRRVARPCPHSLHGLEDVIDVMRATFWFRMMRVRTDQCCFHIRPRLCTPRLALPEPQLATFFRCRWLNLRLYERRRWDLRYCADRLNAGPPTPPRIHPMATLILDGDPVAFSTLCIPRIRRLLRIFGRHRPSFRLNSIP